jgi:hypothetical protein
MAIYAIEVQNNGKLLLGGDFGSVDGTIQNGLVRLSNIPYKLQKVNMVYDGTDFIGEHTLQSYKATPNTITTTAGAPPA